MPVVKPRPRPLDRLNDIEGSSHDGIHQTMEENEHRAEHNIRVPVPKIRLQKI